MASLHSRVSERRAAAGLSVTELASRVGISRQALSAIEAERSTPSTRVALALARALGCSVEDLFALPDAPVSTDLPSGSRVTLGRVANRWVVHAKEPHDTVPADGIVTADGTVDPLVDLAGLASSALVAGCAPVLGALVGQVDARSGARWLKRTSSDALSALAAGKVHIAGLHLAEHDAPEVHDRIVGDGVPGHAVDLVGLVVWREGLVVAPGNPLGIQGVADLARPGLRVATRPPGSGAARVLDEALATAAIDRVSGPRVATHAAAAQALLHGTADAAVMVEPVATAFGLPFFPLVEERFELAVRADHRGHPGVEQLLEQLTTRRFHREAHAMGPYDTGLSGDVRRVHVA